jgi:hypothetical protein
MERSLGRNGAKLHRTMWPEEIGEMAENVSDMVTNLVRTSGTVRDGEPKVDGVVEQKAEEEKTSKLDEVEEQKVDKKKGKFKWLKKLLVKKKQTTEPEKNSPAQRMILETDIESPPFGPSSNAEPQTLRCDWRYLPSTTAIANPPPTCTDTTPSKSPQDEPARDSTKKPARSTFGRELSRKQARWHIHLPRVKNRMSKAKVFKGATGYVRESQIHRSVPRSRMSIGTRTEYARIPTESRLSVRQGGSRRVATHPSRGWRSGWWGLIVFQRNGGMSLRWWIQTRGSADKVAKFSPMSRSNTILESSPMQVLRIFIFYDRKCKIELGYASIPNKMGKSKVIVTKSLWKSPS